MDFDSLSQLITENRTVRRFIENEPVATETLEKLVGLARFCASGRNAQPLKYVLITSEDTRARVYPLLKWAGYFKDWDGPAEGERPAAYMVQCLDTHYGANCLCDDGLQLEAITLGMCTMGLRGCIIKAFNVPALSEVLGVGERYVPRYVLALGYPAETVRIEDMDGTEDADFKYFRTPDRVHHVPKRPVAELILKDMR
ncbi:MAG: nitroreductase family protein [Muribaculaceae bacterium]|nr:nitroreductase family protein [Muribaculaceae bacterium]